MCWPRGGAESASGGASSRWRDRQRWLTVKGEGSESSGALRDVEVPMGWGWSLMARAEAEAPAPRA